MAKQNGRMVIQLPKGFGGNTEAIAQQINSRVISPVMRNTAQVDPALAKELGLHMLAQCVANMTDLCGTDVAEFERITGVITDAMKAAAQEIKAPNVRVS